jgi:hypothetical protein
LFNRLTKLLNDLPHGLLNKYVKPKTNIVACLNCGAYHEIGRICAKCYAKVKKETDAIFEKLNSDEYKYSYPNQEHVVVYENDSQELKDNLKKDDKKRIIEMPSKRPEWFNTNLMSKVNTK